MINTKREKERLITKIIKLLFYLLEIILSISKEYFVHQNHL